MILLQRPVKEPKPKKIKEPKPPKDKSLSPRKRTKKPLTPELEAKAALLSPEVRKLMGL